MKYEWLGGAPRKDPPHHNEDNADTARTEGAAATAGADVGREDVGVLSSQVALICQAAFLI